jgi:hypothetical protein
VHVRTCLYCRHEHRARHPLDAAAACGFPAVLQRDRPRTASECRLVEPGTRSYLMATPRSRSFAASPPRSWARAP